MWQTIKGGEACTIDLELYNATVQDLETKGAQLRERKDIRGFFTTNVVRVVSETKEALKEDTEHVEVEDVENEAEDDEEVTKQRTKPAQVKLEDDMKKTKLAIENLKTAKVLAVDLESTQTLNKKLKVLEAQLNDQEKKLTKARQNERAQKKMREKRKENFERVRKDYPEIAAQLETKTTVGRPRIESEQPGLLRDVLEIATIGAACGEKRREELFRTVKTLDDLHSAISNLGYCLSRSALHYRLLPKNSRSIDGKRHVVTVPVKLIRYLCQSDKNTVFVA